MIGCYRVCNTTFNNISDYIVAVSFIRKPLTNFTVENFDKHDKG